MDSYQIYRVVCRLYFVEKFTLNEIIDAMGDELINYEHQFYHQKEKFKFPFLAAERIIKNERLAHMQVKSFTDL